LSKQSGDLGGSVGCNDYCRGSCGGICRDWRSIFLFRSGGVVGSGICSGGGTNLTSNFLLVTGRET
jgi:hypothetical protein